MQHKQPRAPKEKLKQLLQKLVRLWKNDWDNADYPGKILPELMKDLDNCNPTEGPVIEKIQAVVARNEWDTLPGRLRKAHQITQKTPELHENLKHMISDFQLNKAQALFQKYSQVFDKNAYEAERSHRITKRRNAIMQHLQDNDLEMANNLFEKSYEVLTTTESAEMHEWFESEAARRANIYLQQRIIPLLKEYRFEEARSEFQIISKYADSHEYQTIEEKYRSDQGISKEKQALAVLLLQQDFKGAQEAFKQMHYLPVKQFMKLMGRHVQAYFKDKLRIDIDLDKATALSTVSQRTLVKARAGSGKTMLLACFVKLLVEKFDVSPDQILVMAFNKKAAHVIRERIQKDLAVPEFSNARTFHSLAWHLVPAEEKSFVLADNEASEEYEKNRTQRIEKIWKALRRRRPQLSLLAYLMLRRESTLAQDVFDPESDEYYLYRRNECQSSLRGEPVKSKGEKYIADFLLEHDIHYSYERTYRIGTSLYNPDFTIWDGKDPKIIIEHWAIDPDNPRSHVPDHWETTTKQYRSDILDKREYWRKKKMPLLETNAQQVYKKGREGFEKHLESLLIKEGICCEKLLLDEIKRRISDKITRKLIKLFGDLISRAKKAGYTPAQVKKLYNADSEVDTRTRAFGNIAWRVYQEYEDSLTKGATDYDSLLSDARKQIDKLQGNIEVDDHTRGSFGLPKLKWLLIDEFQDFSILFDDLVESMMKWNPDLRILCVGDDWQAINGFAGSDLRFIQAFGEASTDSISVDLPTNRRSRANIVKAGNKFMQWMGGRQARSLPGMKGGNVRFLYVDEMYIDRHSSEDQQFLVPRKGHPKETEILLSKYIKLLTGLIAKDPARSYSILTRTNQVGSISKEMFMKKLSASLEKRGIRKKDQHIDVSTVHKYKGRESDVTVVLRVIHRQFPLIHPDWTLLAPLGTTLQDVIDEERRLFYVAISRAREEVILVTEKGRKSNFIQDYIDSYPKKELD